MTDPNGNRCAWNPGNDGFCPSGSNSSPKTIRTYQGAVGVVQADHIRVAMTRSVTDEAPLLETATVAPGEEVVHAPVLLDGEPLEGSFAPRIAAIDDRVYLAWTDVAQNSAMGAPLAFDGSVRAEQISHLGEPGGVLRRVGDRFLLVHAIDAEGELRGTWIDREGRVEGTSVFTRNAEPSRGLEVSHHGGNGAIAVVYTTQAAPTGERELVIAQIAADGSYQETAVMTLAQGEATGYVEAVITRDDGALALVQVTHSAKPTMSLVRLAPDGTVGIEPTTVAAPIEMVDNGDTILVVAAAQSAPCRLYILDARGAFISGPIVMEVARAASALATPDGFALIHATADAPVALTSMRGTQLDPPVTIARRTVETGCGCRSTNGSTGSLFVIAGAILLRRSKTGRRAVTCRFR